MADSWLVRVISKALGMRTEPREHIRVFDDGIVEITVSGNISTPSGIHRVTASALVDTRLPHWRSRVVRTLRDQVRHRKREVWLRETAKALCSGIADEVFHTEEFTESE